MCQRVYACFDLFFKFCTDREKIEQAEKKTYDGSAEAFIFYWIIIIVIVPLSVQDFFFFSPCFCSKRNFEHLRET